MINLKRYSNFIVNVFTVILVLISLLGAISLLAQDIMNASKACIIMLDIIFILAILYLLKKEKVKAIIKMVIKTLYQSKWVLPSIMLLLIIWQLYLLITFSGSTNWDPNLILLKATNHFFKGQHLYFSNYPNLSFILFYEHFLWMLSGKLGIKGFTYLLGLINIFVIDISLLLLYSISKALKGAKMYVLLISIIIFGMLPWFCIPYTDCFSFLICTLLILYFLKYINGEFNILSSICLGFIILIGYLLKPSLIILVIAFIIVSFAFHKLHKNTWITFLVILIGIFGWNKFVENNEFTRLDSSQAFSMYHYSAMGSHGTGGYDEKDVNRDESIKNRNKRGKTDYQITLENYKKLGAIGTQLFFINKQVRNTSNGSLGWGQEGHFFKPFLQKNTLGIKLFGHFGEDGYLDSYSNLVSTCLQIIWCFLLFTILFSVYNYDSFSQVLKYSLVGICLFLLLFEGGRSRYFIQILPVMIILSSMGIDNLKERFSLK